MIEIVVRFDSGPLSPNRTRRLYWTAIRRLTDAAKYAAEVGWLEAGRPVAAAPWPVVVDVTIRRGRRMDRDNATASLKGVIDGLFKGRITPDDSETYIDLRAPVQEIGRQWQGREEIIFRVRPIALSQDS